MTKSQRIASFGIGLAIGLVMVNHLLARRAEKKRATERLADLQNIPGLLLDYAQVGRPVYGDGVIEAAVGPGAEGFAQTRRVITGSRHRYAGTGVELPAEFLGITEYYAVTGKLTENTPVKRFDFAYADRIRVVVKAPEDTGAVFQSLKPLGGRLSPEPGSRTIVVARFPSPGLATVDAALAVVRSLSGVVSAEPVRLDWRKELIRN